MENESSTGNSGSSSPLSRLSESETAVEPVVDIDLRFSDPEPLVIDLPEEREPVKEITKNKDKSRSLKLKKRTHQKVQKRKLKYRKLFSSHRKKILGCNCRLTLASKQEIKTCFSNYNKMKARGLSFGKFYFFKDLRKNLFALKIHSRINCLVLKFQHKNTRNFKRFIKRRLLKQRQLKYLMMYSGVFD